MTDDDFDWERQTGDTPSLDTGPFYDHSKGYNGGGMYLLLVNNCNEIDRGNLGLRLSKDLF